MIPASILSYHNLTYRVEVWQPIEGDARPTRKLWDDAERRQRRELVVSFECPFQLFLGGPNSKVVEYDISLRNDPV